MPVYSTIETIKEGITSGAYTKWKVFDQDENLMNTFVGLESTTPTDAWSNLESFIHKMSGDGYIVIKAYPKEFKFGKGGDTSSVLKYYFRLNEQQQSRAGSGFSGSGISLDMYLAQMQQINDLRTQLAIKEITDKLTVKQVKDTSYFEKVAESIGKSFAQEFIKKNGAKAGEVVAPAISGATEPEPVNKVEQPEPEKIKTVFKRTGEATVRIMKIAKQYGSDFDAVAESFEDIANMAESNPMKLQELFTKLKENE